MLLLLHNLKGQSEHSGLCPDTSSLVIIAPETLSFLHTISFHNARALKFAIFKKEGILFITIVRVKKLTFIVTCTLQHQWRFFLNTKNYSTFETKRINALNQV